MVKTTPEAPKKRPTKASTVVVHPYPQIPMALELGEIGPRHLVLGDRNHQVECLAHLIRQALGSVEIVETEILSDHDVLNAVCPTIWVVPMLRDGSLAQGTMAGLHKWVSAPMTPGTAGANALVRVAAGYAGVKKPGRATIEAVSRWVMEDNTGDHIDTMMWDAFWHMTDPRLDARVGEDRGSNQHPWTNAWGWFDGKIPLEKRLHILYKDLAGWVFSQGDDVAQLKRLGISPSKGKWLKELKLPVPKVETTVRLLSAWRSRQGDPYRVAMEISTVWAR